MFPSTFEVTSTKLNRMMCLIPVVQYSVYDDVTLSKPW